jgi:nitroreductase
MFANTYIELKRLKHQQRAIAGLWQYDRLRCQHGRHHVRQHAMMTLAFSAVGLQLTTAGGITLAVKIRAACEQLGIDGTGLTVSAALRACSKEAGIEQSGPIIAQTDHLVEQLGISFDASPPLGEEPGTEGDEPSASLSVHAVMSAPAMVHRFSQQDVPEEAVARAMACQFWAPNHKLKGSWRLLQLGPESRLAAAKLSAEQAPSKVESRFEALRHIPGCCAVVCKAFYEAGDRVEKEEQRALTAVHNLALGLSSQGLGVKWVTGAITENYELWELIHLEPNEEVVVGLLWYGWPAVDGVRPVKDQTSVTDKLCRLP